MTGPGRGSSAGSLVNYCLGITKIDPIKHHLLFERYLNPGTVQRFNIGIDFSGDVSCKGILVPDFIHPSALKILSLIKDTVDEIASSEGEYVDLYSIPLDDKATFDILCAGKTTGVFQFESKEMQAYLQQLHPTSFNDLVVLNTLNRPYLQVHIPSLFARKSGEVSVSYPIPCMRHILGETCGIIVYQEQVMLLLQELAGFTKVESNRARWSFHCNKRSVLSAMKEQFLEGGARKGHSIEILQQVWNEMETKAPNSFNKSHSVSYTLIAYQTAYMKAHYRAAYEKTRKRYFS